jgi:sugar O-acyltransferase (sialic acid O-acetyltransferase NeuD family)
MLQQQNHLKGIDMYLYGASGHCKVIIDIITALDVNSIKGILDDYPKCETIFDIPVLNTRLFETITDKQLIISIGNNKIRKKISESCSANYLTALHPRSIVASHVTIGDGTVVMAGAIINPGVKVGKHCIINTGAVVEHDCVIYDFVHISPNVSLAGDVIVGEGSHIGIGTSVIQGVKIGNWATIGAGSVIIKDVPDYAVVVGNPGKIIKYNKENE